MIEVHDRVERTLGNHEARISTVKVADTASLDPVTGTLSATDAGANMCAGILLERCVSGCGTHRLDARGWLSYVNVSRRTRIAAAALRPDAVVHLRRRLGSARMTMMR